MPECRNFLRQGVNIDDNSFGNNWLQRMDYPSRPFESARDSDIKSPLTAGNAGMIKAHPTAGNIYGWPPKVT
jgi:hypothetical protein